MRLPDWGYAIIDEVVKKLAKNLVLSTKPAFKLINQIA